MPYINRSGKTETLTMTIELPLPVSNAQVREPIAQIKQRAPTRYYTQNRMVNGEDYTNFPYTQFNSIIKSKALNRSSIGVSKNLDLLDPTGKYSSSNSFANDGAMWIDDTSGFLSLVINTSGNIITFLTTTLGFTLSSNRVIQYYNQNYSQYTIDSVSGDGTTYWQTQSVDANSLTGYFYSISNSSPLPMPIGTYSSFNMKYVTPGALIKFSAPAGYYFDQNNRLVSGVPGSSDKTAFWTTVLTVYGDGYNNGQGGFSNGLGPVTLNGYVPAGAIITTVLPTFDSSLSTELIQEAIIRMELQQSFSLEFNNSLTIAEDRWSIGHLDDSNWLVKFTSQGNNRYSITYRSLAYYFGSVSDTRFAFDLNKLVYDPFTGKILQDYIKVLATNTQPNSNYALAEPVQISIVGQTVEADGYVNDFAIEVASTDINKSLPISALERNRNSPRKPICFKYLGHLKDPINGIFAVTNPKSAGITPKTLRVGKKFRNLAIPRQHAKIGICSKNILDFFFSHPFNFFLNPVDIKCSDPVDAVTPKTVRASERTAAICLQNHLIFNLFPMI